MRLRLPPGPLGGSGVPGSQDARRYGGFLCHTIPTGERTGSYEDFGSLGQLARGYRDAYVYESEYSRHRRRRHGAPVTDIPARRFVVFSQTHDQVGNRMLGERLTAPVDFESLNLAAAILLSPFVPSLFMGEGYGETAPFRYFVSHTDEALVEVVRRGRAEEFASFGFDPVPTPDPRSEEAFERSKLHSDDRRSEALPAPSFRGRAPEVPVAGDGWGIPLHSADGRWGGPGRDAGAPHAVVFVREGERGA